LLRQGDIGDIFDIGGIAMDATFCGMVTGLALHPSWVEAN
jgi:hypothetical protein